MPRPAITNACMICGGKYHSRGFCRSHYRKLFENKKRTEKVKNDPILYAKALAASRAYKLTSEGKESKYASDKKYYQKNVTRLRRYRREWDERKRFSTLRSNILFRDGNKCSLCDSVSQLVIHHKNGMGRGTDNPDNSPNNLVTLCKSCHMKLHHPTKGLTNLT